MRRLFALVQRASAYQKERGWGEFFARLFAFWLWLPRLGRTPAPTPVAAPPIAPTILEPAPQIETHVSALAEAVRALLQQSHERTTNPMDDRFSVVTEAFHLLLRRMLEIEGNVVAVAEEIQQSVSATQAQLAAIETSLASNFAALQETENESFINLRGSVDKQIQILTSLIRNQSDALDNLAHANALDRLTNLEIQTGSIEEKIKVLVREHPSD